jgi:hypothetical protein
MNRLKKFALVTFMFLFIFILLLTIAAAIPTAARNYGNPRECPIPATDGGIIRGVEQMAAWNEAKILMGAPMGWKAPGVMLRHNQFYVDEDGGVYGGFYFPPTPVLDPKTGRVVACEYIEIWLPDDSTDALVSHVMTHEYLHSLVPRMLDVFGEDALEPDCTPLDYQFNGCEAYVRKIYPVPPGWEEITAQ